MLSRWVELIAMGRAYCCGSDIVMSLFNNTYLSTLYCSPKWLQCSSCNVNTFYFFQPVVTVMNTMPCHELYVKKKLVLHVVFTVNNKIL